jgi:hypothetical protein
MLSANTVSTPRGRGQPKLGDARLQCTVPQRVMQMLIQRENEIHIYRTRVAARVLCRWASAKSGKEIAPYHDEHLIQ